MARYFDEAAWTRAVRQPDWYLRLYPELHSLMKQWRARPDSPHTAQSKAAVLDFFEAVTRNGALRLAASGQNLDAGRQPIDTVVIHHTSSPPGYSLARLNVTQMLRVYVPYYNHPTVAGEEGLRGQLLWSNHVRDGQPVFYAYHWLLRMDGHLEHLLEDDQIGWHAGNWEINCRSVAICLDNDYAEQDPSPAVLEKLGKCIAEQYPQVALERIIGHCEVSQTRTICPGATFKTTWKRKLIDVVKSYQAT